MKCCRYWLRSSLDPLSYETSTVIKWVKSAYNKTKHSTLILVITSPDNFWYFVYIQTVYGGSIWLFFNQSSLRVMWISKPHDSPFDEIAWFPLIRGNIAHSPADKHWGQKVTHAIASCLPRNEHLSWIKSVEHINHNDGIIFNQKFAKDQIDQVSKFTSNTNRILSEADTNRVRTQPR